MLFRSGVQFPIAEAFIEVEAANLMRYKACALFDAGQPCGAEANMDDPVRTHGDAAHARDLGMTGKLCIHPRQVVDVLTAFAPTQTEIDWAERVLASGDGAASVNGEMVDEPVRIRARAILASATGL